MAATKTAESVIPPAAAGWADYYRDIYSTQFRHWNGAVEQGYKLGQVYTNFFQSQISETARVAQEGVKASWGLTEDYRALCNEVFEKTANLKPLA